LPRSSRVNPSLTIYAWGLRVGNLVAQEIQRAARPQHTALPGSTRAP
jgi:hypothetical protein